MQAATKIQELSTKITQAQDAYYNGVAEMEDFEFDALVDELTKLDPKHPTLAKVGAEPTKSSPWKKSAHKINMGSLDKINTPEELQQWYDKVGAGSELFVSEKLDGISIELVYKDGKLEQAITRGNGVQGEDILVNVSKMRGVVRIMSQCTFTGSLRGEIILTKTNHQKYFSDKANPRNTASGVSKRLDGEGVEHLDVLLYQVLGDEKFATEAEQFQFLSKIGCKTPNHYVYSTTKLVVEKWQEYQDKIRAGLDYDIDGLVVRLNDLAKQQAAGSKDMRPKAARAFKFGNEAQETVLLDIEWQTGNTGRITPVAICEPVVISGVEVKRASLYNAAYVNELGLGVGAKVILVRANDVIPRVEAVISPPKQAMKAPEKCPVCQTKAIVNGEYLECPNWDCFARVTGRIKNYAAALNILELGETLIDRLVENGLVKNVSDLYDLTIEELSNVERIAETSATNVYNSIWERNPVSLDVLLGALSIPLVGSSTIRLLMAAGYDTLDSILEMEQSTMETIKGIGPARGTSLFKGLLQNKEMVHRMTELGLELKENTKKLDGKLTGKSFVITGTLSVKRDVIVDMIESEGGEVRGSVSKGTTYLIIADPASTSVKANKARALGTILISEEQFRALI